MNIDMILPAIQERAAKAPALGKTMKFDFGQQIVYIDGMGETNTVSADDKDADCVIIISPENFTALLEGKLNPMMAVMTGKVKIKGDMSVAMKLQSLLS